MISEPSWIREDVVLAIHKRQIAEHGGAEGLRDYGLLSSALSKPLNLYQYGNPKPDIAALASSYACGIANNDPFVDGNKRTALVTCRLFLKLNDADLKASGEEKYKAIIQLTTGKLTEEDFAEWIRSNL